MKKEYDADDEFDANIVLLRCESSLTTSPVSGARLTLAPALSDGYYFIIIISIIIIIIIIVNLIIIMLGQGRSRKRP